MRNIFPKFNEERQLKSTLTGSMWSDANDFLWRVDILNKNSDFSGFTWWSKIYVDLLMSVESDLKAIIMSLSKEDETPEIAYKVLRSKGHSIENLYNEVERRSKNRLKLLSHKDKEEMLKISNRLTVSNRYKLITFLKIRSERGHGKEFQYGHFSFLLNYKAMKSFEKIALKLHEISRISMERNTDINAMNGNYIGDYYKRIKEFEKNMGTKL
jgi:hypothetical protein